MVLHGGGGDHVDALIKKLNSRLYFLRRMANFNIRSEILEMFYTSTICGVWRYCLICWGGNVTILEKDRLDGIRKKAEIVIGSPHSSALGRFDLPMPTPV